MKAKKILKVIIALCIVLACISASLFYDIFQNGFRQEAESGQEEIVELRLVYAYQNLQWNSAIETVIASFEEEYPDIDVVYEISYQDSVYEDVLSKKIARNELGDIVQLKTPEAYAATGLLGEITDELADDINVVYTYDGKVYGVGAVESTWGVLYNKDIFDEYGLEEPRTYDDFLEICSTLKENNITPIGVGGSDLWHMEYWTNHFFRMDVLSQDADWLKKCSAGEVSWEDELPRKMMEHMKGLFQAGYVNENWLSTTDVSLSYKMTEEEIAMIYTGPWTAAAIQKLDSDMELGWFYVPDEKGVVYATDNQDTFWSITAECAEDESKYQAAMTFLNYFYSREAYKTLCQTTYTFPLTDVGQGYEMTGIQEDVISSFDAADYRITTYIGNEDTPEEFEKNMLVVVRDILDGSAGIDDGLKKIQSIWEQYNKQEGAQ